MSRGPGSLQRKILQCLEPDQIMEILAIAARTHGMTITRAQYESLRRALNSLECARLIYRMSWLEVDNKSLWTNSAGYSRAVEYMARLEERKSCNGDRSNTYHGEATS